MNWKDERDEDRILCQQPSVSLSPAGAERGWDGAKERVVVCERHLSGFGQSCSGALVGAEREEVRFDKVDFTREITRQLLVVQPLFSQQIMGAGEAMEVSKACARICDKQQCRPTLLAAATAFELMSTP